MRFWIPLTGTLLPDNSGDPDDNIRIIRIDLGDVAWHAVHFDWDKGLVQVELDAPPRQVGRRDKDGNPKPDETPAAYNERRSQALAHVQGLLNRPVDELYEMSGSARLKQVNRGTS